MNSVGGYFGLELSRKNEYHDNAIRLNTGRNALEYIIRAKGLLKIYLPFFSCDVLLEPIERVGIEYEFYSISECFEPIFDFKKIKKHQALLYINYFGLKNKFINGLQDIAGNVIIDNSQSFFSAPLAQMDTFYSPRKFFGVPDGAYLYTDTLLFDDIKMDTSFERFEHLLRRIDVGAENGYDYFIKNDKSLSGKPILQMSNLTRSLLQSIEYPCIILKRRENFIFLHQLLKKHNTLKIYLEDEDVPMAYPFYSKKPKVRSQLLANKVFTPIYWKNVLSWVDNNTVEYDYVENIVYLPIDQRYGLDDLIRVVELIEDELGR
ncbi:hypothetical protein GCM10011375_09570 [Hymenobacter qilianensis]|uniref:Uncharacterized protein n=2 Tax=Hymenobacter qilianensis TaxID=1385715 RepID=A0ACB5PNI2_9BACT|nr:hypothetical protein [Hymenobacter qilianensis]QNP53437.1 hypothetical protein H9L05_07595 [Hymenobacter qilianensis]GGF56536.1 hypothetical protein GCM10011375_09570 [Hymenobacter qilianensis]